MFKILYAKSVLKDLKKIAPQNLPKIKEGITSLQYFPDLTQIKHLKNHPIADYRLKIGNYRVLFDVDWMNKEIHVLKVAHRKNVY